MARSLDVSWSRKVYSDIHINSYCLSEISLHAHPLIIERYVEDKVQLAKLIKFSSKRKCEEKGIADILLKEPRVHKTAHMNYLRL